MGATPGSNSQRRPPKQRTMGQKWRAVSLNNKLIVVFSGVTMLATVIYTIVAGWTLREIHSGSADTHDLAVAAKTQAQKMQSMSEAADKIRNASEDMVAQNKRIAEDSEKAIEASNKQSKAVLDATISASRLDQRAWIGIGDFRVIQFERDKSLKIDIQIRNSGKTPALNVVEGVNWVAAVPMPFQDQWFNMIVSPGEAIPPQGVHAIHLEIKKEAVIPVFDGIRDGSRIFYVFGTLNYKTMGQDGFTEFCLLMTDTVATPPSLGYCAAHNSMR